MIVTRFLDICTTTSGTAEEILSCNEWKTGRTSLSKPLGWPCVLQWELITPQSI